MLVPQVKDHSLRFYGDFWLYVTYRRRGTGKRPLERMRILVKRLGNHPLEHSFNIVYGHDRLHIHENKNRRGGCHSTGGKKCLIFAHADPTTSIDATMDFIGAYFRDKEDAYVKDMRIRRDDEIGGGVGPSKTITTRKKNRSRLQLRIDVLRAIKEGKTIKNQIIRGCNISHNVLMEIQTFLLERKMLVKRKDKKRGTVLCLTPEAVRCVNTWDYWEREFKEALT